MQTVRILSPTAAPEPVPRAVALGLFDGVHLGHRRVIYEAVGHDGLRAAVFSFGRAAAALKPNASALCTKAQKETYFRLLGVDEWLRADFDAFRHLSPEDFVEQVLDRQLHAKVVCCGNNFHFGHRGSGDVVALQALCAARGIRVIAVPELTDDEGAVSSDRIRRLIERGDVGKASTLLGHPFSLELPIVHGHQLGRTIGSPTANQVLPPHFVLPRAGVYTSAVVIDGRTYYGVSNVGVHPTVGAEVPTCETWIEDFNGDIYGRTLSVTLTSFLRDEQRFPSLDALKQQIQADRDRARAAREDGCLRAVFFDFDDTLQDRPVAFRRYARFFLHKYRPELSPEDYAPLVETMLTLNRGGYVDYPTFFTDMPKAVGVANPPPSAVLFAEYQRIFPNFVELFPDAADTLRAVKARGLKVGILTNGPAVQQHRKIDVSGLRPLTDLVMVSGEEDVAKPDGEFFRRAAARLGLSPSQCLMVGDHPVNDIEGARSVGMRAVFMDTANGTASPKVPAVHRVSDCLAYI